MIEVYAEKCSPVLKATKLEPGGKLLTSAVVEMVRRQVRPTIPVLSDFRQNALKSINLKIL